MSKFKHQTLSNPTQSKPNSLAEDTCDVLQLSKSQESGLNNSRLLENKNIENKDNNYIHTCPPNSTKNPNGRGKARIFLKNKELKNRTILIPKKVRSVIENHISEHLLTKVDIDRQEAIDLCMIFLSSVIATKGKEEYKSLHSDILTKRLGSNYRRVVELLLTGSPEKGSIIEILKLRTTEYYKKGVISKSYRLTKTYRGKGYELYDIQTPRLIKREYELRKLVNEINKDNHIVKNLEVAEETSSTVKKKSIKERAKFLISNKFYTKRGKKLTMSKRYDHKNKKVKRAYVEDDIALWESLTKNGFIEPTVSEEAGGRVTSSFTLMPSWIRSMYKINGEKSVTVDYTCLHPNIAMLLYGGKSQFISHAKVAEESGIDISKVKQEHLSFFNRPLEGTMLEKTTYKGGKAFTKKIYMKPINKSPLWNYYQEREPKMMAKLIEQKKKEGYKSTSKSLFKKEVEIITACIVKLNKENIFPIYLYDALMCAESQASRVREVMNETVLEFNVKTEAKYEND
jgi:hypothetical protein